MNKLATLLRETADLLDQNGDRRWAKWLREDSASLAAGNIRGAEHFLSAFGGMGSLTDFYSTIRRQKGEDEKSLDEKISERLDISWQLATQLLKNRK